MEEKTRSTTVHGMYFGLATGAALVVLSLILFLTNLYMNKGVTWISYLVLIGGMVYGTLEYRKNFSNGFLTYGQAFSTLFKIGLFAAVVSAIYIFIFAQFIHPGFSQEILDQSREQMVNSGKEMTQEQMDIALSWTAKFTTPVMLLVFGFIMNLFGAAIIGLIAAIFLKKEDPSLNATL